MPSLACVADRTSLAPVLLGTPNQSVLGALQPQEGEPFRAGLASFELVFGAEYVH